MKGIIDRALQGHGKTPLTSEVTCRGKVCLVKVPGAPDQNGWRRRLEESREFSRYNEGGSLGPQGAFYVIGDASRPQGTDLLQELVTKFKASTAPTDCAARFPGKGEAELRFNVPEPGEPNDDGQEGKISARMGGTLAGTPLGKCLQEEIDRRILSVELPPRVRGAVLFTEIDFPLRPAASKR